MLRSNAPCVAHRKRDCPYCKTGQGDPNTYNLQKDLTSQDPGGVEEALGSMFTPSSPKGYAWFNWAVGAVIIGGSLALIVGLCINWIESTNELARKAGQPIREDYPARDATHAVIKAPQAVDRSNAPDESEIVPPGEFYYRDVAVIKRAVMADVLIPESARFCPRFGTLRNKRGNLVYVSWYRSKDLLGTEFQDNIVAEVDGLGTVLYLNVGGI